MVGFGRDLCGSSSPNALPKQGHLQQVAQDLVLIGIIPYWLSFLSSQFNPFFLFSYWKIILPLLITKNIHPVLFHVSFFCVWRVLSFV